MSNPRTGGNVGQKLSFVDFQLPMLVDQPPEGDGWLHEVKHDGYRTQLILERGRARALTRNGLDWSEKYQSIVDEAAALKARSAIVDGEVIVFNDKGVSDFAALRSAIRWEPGRLVFIAFDLMHVDGNDLNQWAGDFGENGLSDADADGDSDGSDFLAWQRSFGISDAAVDAAAVPEPASILFAAGSLLCAAARPRLWRGGRGRCSCQCGKA